MFTNINMSAASLQAIGPIGPQSTEMLVAEGVGRLALSSATRQKVQDLTGPHSSAEIMSPGL